MKFEMDDHLPLVSVQWEEFLSKGIYEIYNKVSKTKLKELVSTVKALMKWLEKED